MYICFVAILSLMVFYASHVTMNYIYKKYIVWLSLYIHFDQT